MGGILEMANDRLYGFWGDLETALHAGKPQNEIKQLDRDVFAELYADPARLEQFLDAMAGVQMGNLMALAETFDFSAYTTLCDMGGASGALSIHVAMRHPQLHCISADLPAVEPIARRRIEAAGVADRVQARVLDFHRDPWRHHPWQAPA